MEYTPLDMKILWLAMTVKPVTFYALMDYYGDVDEIWENFDDSDTGLKFISNEIKTTLDKTRDLSYVSKCIEKWKSPKFMTVFGDNYPKLLKEICDPPIVLFYKGSLDFFDRYIAIVGSRKCSNYGLEVARSMGRGLGSSGVSVVSGGARGIDSAAHMGTLETGGKTVCVLGCGLDVVYPPENGKLFEDIVQKGGAIITEYFPGEKPAPWHFPERNRIISGMCQGVVVIEANEKSGALITANMAINEGRDVFAVPGNINSIYSNGTNNLIKNGAGLVRSHEDILMEYDWDVKCEVKKNIDNYENLDDTEKTVVQAIASGGQIAIDDLYIKIGMDIGQLNSIVTMLEISGTIKRLPGNILTI